MVNSVNESKKASILAWGVLLVTILVTDRIGTDTVNVGKMLVLSVVSFCLIPFLEIPSRKTWLKRDSWFVAIVALISLIFISMLTSKNVFERGLYGAFGRNTGFLSYFALSILFIVATQLYSPESFSRIQKSLVLAGTFNLFYCLAAHAGYDIFAWANPYKAALGTFGNPDFIGAFMGIFASVLFINLISFSGKRVYRIIIGIALILTFEVIHQSHALQGLLVAGFGMSAALYFYMRINLKRKLFSQTYLIALVITGIVALLGIFQKGPLASFLYKPSVSYRGDYWKTGIHMGMKHLLNGVGIDSYGLYFRTFRSLKSTINPGIETTTDASHNVYIDIFAGAGGFAFIIYIFITIFVLVICTRYIKKMKRFDAVFFSLFLAWVGYQLQSIISINQLGLAVWGWTLGGALIAYTRTQNIDAQLNLQSHNPKGAKVKKSSPELMPASMLIKVVGSGLVGLLLALPPFIADAKMRQFLSGKGTTQALVKLAESWPRDSIRLNKSIVALANNNDLEGAKKLAAFGTTVFPNDFASWSALFELSPDGSPEKAAYKKRLHEIDPFNPKYYQ